MKISHSASPRNRSSRSSRSPAGGQRDGRRGARGAPRRGRRILRVRERRSGNSIGNGRHRAPSGSNLSRWRDVEMHQYRPATCRQDTSGDRAGCALGRNYVETAIGIARRRPPSSARQLVPPDFLAMLRQDFGRRLIACTAPLPARSKSPSNRTSCRSARRPNAANISGPTPSSSPMPATRPCSCDAALDHHRRHRPQAGSAAAKAWSASSRCSRPASASNTPRGVPLPTASGFMTGRYQMVSESGERFEIDVPTFSLDSPDSKRC